MPVLRIRLFLLLCCRLLKLFNRVQVLLKGLLDLSRGDLLFKEGDIGLICLLIGHILSRLPHVVRARLKTRREVIGTGQVVLIFIMMHKHIDVLESEVEFLDDGHLLVIKVDLVLAHNMEESRRGQTAKKLLIALMLHDLEHPQNRVRTDYLLLARRLILIDVEQYDLQKLFQDSRVLRMLQRHEDFDEISLISQIARILRIVLQFDELYVLVRCVFNLFLTWLLSKPEQGIETGESIFGVSIFVLLVEDFFLLGKSLPQEAKVVLAR